MNWNDRSVVPPLGKSAIERGNKDGGHSIELLFKHRSGRISCGQAVLHEGKVAWWYPGEFEDNIHSPEMPDDPDPIVQWVECPSPEEIVEAMEGMGC